MRERKKSKVELAREQILREITMGNYPRGSVLPPEREMAEQIGVSYMTLRKAVGALVEEHYLERAHGSGTFVCSEISESKLQKLLGVVIPAWSAPENLDFIMHLYEAAAQANWLVKVIFARSWAERTIQDLWQNCDAMVCRFDRDLSAAPAGLLTKFRERTKPLIFCGAPYEDIGADVMTGASDPRAICRKLYELGHRRILQVDQQIMVKGIRQPLHPNLWSIGEYMRSHYAEIEVNDERFLLDVPQFGLPHRTARDTLLQFQDLKLYSLIICPLSLYWGIVAALVDRGVRIPAGMSVLAVGDRQEAEFYRPRPTIFCESLRRTAFKVFDLLRRCEQSENLPPQTVKIPFELIDGETLGAVRSLPRTAGKCGSEMLYRHPDGNKQIKSSEDMR